MSFIPLKGGCPVCVGERRDCRKNDKELYFCRGDNPSPAFVFKKYDAHGFGIFVEKALQDEQDAARSAEYRRERELKNRQRLAEEAARRAQSLSPEERDREIRKLLGQLSLKQKHQDDLMRRGLTREAIAQGMYRSVDRWQKLDQPISNRLAGIGLDGRALTHAQSGYICPVWSAEGLIIGWQLRLDDASEGGKYRWPSSNSEKRPNGPKAHLRNGELPITVCRPDGTPKGIALSEGILKPYVITQLSGYITIGAAGGNPGKQQLKEALEKLSAELGINQIIYIPDAGGIANKQVYRRDCGNIRLIRSWGYEVVIPDWGQFHDKSQPDFDELLAGGGEVERFVSAAEYLALGGNEEEAIAVLPLTQRQRDEIAWRALKKYTPTKTVNQRFLVIGAPKSGEVTAVNSGLNTGKTQYLADHVASDEKGRQINIGYRNSLLLQMAQKLGSYHLDAHNGYQILKDPDARLSLCWDSLLKLPTEIFEGATLYIDEGNSVLPHGLTSSTCKENRLPLLRKFEEIAPLCDRIIVLDGNLTDFVVDYLSTISGKPVTKIKNEFKGDTPPVFFLNPEKEGRISKNEWAAFSQAIRNAKRPAIATDSRLEAETLAKLLEADGKKGILLTARTAAEGWAKSLLADPTPYIERTQPDFFIFTPVAESGLDIPVRNYFSDMFVAIFGVLGPDEAMQISRRVRYPERIIILCAEKGLPPKGNEPIYQNQLSELLSGLATAEATALSDKELIEKAKEAIAEQVASPHFALWLKIQQKKDLERRNLRHFLIKNFEDGGYDVQFRSLISFKSDEHSAAKQLCKDEESQQIFNAEDIPLDEALDIERNLCASWSDRCKAIKARLKARLPGIEHTSLWIWEFIRRVRFEDRELLSRLEAAWLFSNPEDAEYLQRDKWRREMNTFLPDMSTRWQKLKALEKLGIEKFLDPTKAWDNESPELQELVKACKRKAIAALFGHPGKLSPIQWLNKLLSQIGAKLTCKQERIEGIRKRTYRFTDKSRAADWGELYAMTDRRMVEKIASIKMARSFTEQGLAPVTPDTENISTSAPGVSTSPWMSEDCLADVADWLSSPDRSTFDALIKELAVPAVAIKAALGRVAGDVRDRCLEWLGWGNSQQQWGVANG